MHTLNVFVRQLHTNICVLPLKEVDGKMTEAFSRRCYRPGEWNWPDYIIPFLGNRKTLSRDLCLTIEKLGVCTFVQHIDPNHLIH